jgi:hypothetical protein
MQRIFCEPYRCALATRAASSEVIRRLENYTPGYAERLAERRR